MKGIAALLWRSQARLVAVQSHLDAAADHPTGEGEPPVDTGYTAELAAACMAVDTANADALDAAILYLQNRYLAVDLMEGGADMADDTHRYDPANDADLQDSWTLPDQGTGMAPHSGMDGTEKADADRFGCCATAHFHAGLDWIALDAQTVARAPMAWC